MASELEAAIAELVGAAELIVSRAPPSFTVPLAAALRRYRDAGGADGVEPMRWRARLGDRVLGYFVDTPTAAVMTRGMDASGLLVERLDRVR